MGYEYRAVIDGTEYFNADIYSCVAENSVMQQSFEIGNVTSGRLDILVRPKSDNISRMASVNLYVREIGTETWRDKGKYFIAIRKSDKDKQWLNLECYDIIRSFGVAFRVEGEQPDWPMPMTTALSLICEGSSIELDPRTQIRPEYMLEYPNERSIREVLSDIASAHGGNFIMTDTGRLRLVPANNRGAEYDIGLKCMGYTEINSAFLLQRVTMYWDDEEYFTAGIDGGELIVDNSNATQQIANDVQQQLSGHLHIPYEVSKAFINPFFELGDTVIVDGNRRAISGYRTYFSAEIASDLNNPADDEIDDEFECKGDMERAFSRLIKEGGWYYGVSITRKHGIQIKRTDGASEMTMNSDMWEVIVGGERVLYIDYTSDPPRFIFNGELGADVVIANEAVIGSVYADNGAIANLVVNRLRTDYMKPWLYLAGDTSTVHWIDIHDEEFAFMVSEVKEPGTERYANMDGEPLFWRNNEVGGKMTLAETDESVIIYKYTDSATGSWAHRMREHDYGTAIMPVLALGRGDDNGRMKARVFKYERGFRIEYDHSDGDEYFLEIGEDGIASNPPIRNTLANFDALDIRSDEFTVTVEDDEFTFETPKDDEGRIISVNGHGANRAITYGQEDEND